MILRTPLRPPSKVTIHRYFDQSSRRKSCEISIARLSIQLSALLARPLLPATKHFVSHEKASIDLQRSAVFPGLLAAYHLPKWLWIEVAECLITAFPRIGSAKLMGNGIARRCRCTLGSFPTYRELTCSFV